MFICYYCKPFYLIYPRIAMIAKWSWEEVRTILTEEAKQEEEETEKQKEQKEGQKYEQK